MDHPVDHQMILNALNWRYAVHRFDPEKKIPDEQWNALKESLRLSPSSHGLQPWKFFLVRNEELRIQLRQASWNQPQVTESSHYVVFTCRDRLSAEDVDHYIKSVAETRGVALESLERYRNSIIGDLIRGPRAEMIPQWAQRQSYIAMGFVMKAAALMKIDSCPMEGLDPAAYDRLLQIEGSGFTTAAAVAFGYRHAEDRRQSLKKVRFPENEIISVI